MKKIVSCFLLFALISVLTSCSSKFQHRTTAPPAPRVYKPVPKRVPKQENKESLTEAEKKALEEADLWVPQEKK